MIYVINILFQLIMAEIDDRCIFHKFCKCGKKDHLSIAGPERIKRIISVSKIYGEETYIELEKQYKSNDNLTIQVHKNV